MIEKLNDTEIDATAGGPLPALVILAIKWGLTGAGVAGLVLAAEDLSNEPGHNHYGR